MQASPERCKRYRLGNRRSMTIAWLEAWVRPFGMPVHTYTDLCNLCNQCSIGDIE